MSTPSWGDINAVLNRLVRDGVITAFKTNRGDGAVAALVGLHVIVTAPGTDDERRADAVRARVAHALDAARAEAVTVTVDRS